MDLSRTTIRCLSWAVSEGGRRVTRGTTGCGAGTTSTEQRTAVRDECILVENASDSSSSRAFEMLFDFFRGPRVRKSSSLENENAFRAQSIAQQKACTVLVA